jgi:hypothetical protein
MRQNRSAARPTKKQMKIKSLTPEQEIDLKVTYAKWLAIGRSTVPLDRTNATVAIEDIYEAIGEKRPTVLFFSSPAMCVLAYGVLKNRDQLRDQLGGQLRGQLWDQLWDQLGGQLWDQLGGQLGDQLWGQLGGQLRDQLWDQLGGQLRGQLWGQLRGQLGDQLWGQLRGQLGDQLGGQLRGQLRGQLWGQLRGQLGDQLGGQLWGQLNNYFAGNQWCSWEIFYDFCNRIGATYSDNQRKKLDMWMHQSEACHWWFPYKGIVLASERYSALNVDESGRLHCENAPAMKYPDGYSIHAWHGLRISKDIIEHPETITVSAIESEKNAEIRRVMIERYGQSRFIQDSNAFEISRDSTGILYRKELPGDPDGALVMVYVINSTPEPEGSLSRDEALAVFGESARVSVDGRMAPLSEVSEHHRFKDYFLRVPPTMKRAKEAVAWSFEKKEDDYAPMFES